MIRLAAARRTGDLIAAAAAAAGAQARSAGSRATSSSGTARSGPRAVRPRGAVELWSGHLDQAARTLESGLAAAAASGAPDEQAGCLGQLALAEALRGRLGRAATSAAQMTAALPAGQRRPPAAHPAALVALAWPPLASLNPLPAATLLYDNPVRPGGACLHPYYS
jgi:hypothetical protein